MSNRTWSLSGVGSVNQRYRDTLVARAIAHVSIWLVVFCSLLNFRVHGQGPQVGGGNLLGSKWRADESGLIRLRLPMEANEEGRILRTLQEIAASATGNQRPTVVLKFESSAGDASSLNDRESNTIGRDTPFERALALARWLTGPQGARLRSVAYLPQSIEGHAVLVALACEEIAIAPEAMIGNAIANEQKLDGTVRQAYLEVAMRRQAFPAAAVMSMLDASSPLIQVGMVGARRSFCWRPT